MRRALLFCAAIAFAIACGDSITEPIPDRKPTTPPVSFATTTTEDGLSISTDKDDYQPGDTVHFTGSGWQPGDVLDIVLTDDPLTHDPLTWSVNVGADGMFHDSTYVVDEGDLDVKFTLVATSRATGRSLTVQFTDGNLQTVTLAAPTSVTVTQGNSAQYTANVTFGGNVNQCTVTLIVTTLLPAGAVASFSLPNPTINDPGNVNFSRTLTITTTSATPAGTYPFTVQATRGADCQGSGNPTTTGTLVVNAANQAPVVDAGGPYSGNRNTDISLGGATATDPDGDALTYAWTYVVVSAPVGTICSFSNAAVLNPTFKCTNTGTFKVTLSVNDGHGHTVTDDAQVTVFNSAPTANAGPDKSGIEGTPVALTGSASDPDGDPVTYKWTYAAEADVDAGATCSFSPNDAVLSPSVTCTDDGTFKLTLTVTDSDNETGTDVADLVLSNANPTATAGGPYTGNEGSTIQLNGSGDDPGDNDDAGLTYKWTVNTSGIDAGGICTFDDDTKKDATVTCTDDSNGGHFTLSLVVKDDDGGTSTTSNANLTVSNVKPIADAGGPYSGDEGSAIQLGGSGDDPGDNDDGHLTYHWTVNTAGIDAGGTCTFDDANDKNAKITCTDDSGNATGGHFTVTLVVKDDDLGTSDGSSAHLTVANVAPVADAGGPYSGNEGAAIQLQGSASDVASNDVTFTWKWQYTAGPGFINGAACTFDNATAQNPKITCNDNGTVKLTLIAKDDNGTESAPDEATLTVANVNPVADAGGPYSGDEGAAIPLNGTTTDKGTNDTHTWKWEYVAGDGFATGAACTFSSATAEDPTITCTDDGTVQLTFTAKDDDGGEGSDGATLTVKNVAPVAKAGGPYTGAEGTPIPLDGSATDQGEHDVLTYKWTVDFTGIDAGGTCTFDDDTKKDAKVTCTDDSNAGTFTLSLVAKDDDGGTSVASTAVLTVTNANPIATAAGPYSGNEGSAIQLNGSADDPGNNDDAGLTYLWTVNTAVCTFDDATKKNAKVTCTDNGTFTLTLTAKDDDLGTGTSTATLVVANLPPTITSLNVSPTVVQIGGIVTLSAQFTDPGHNDTHTASIDWEGATSSGVVTEANGSGSVSATHTYTGTGIYTVSLTVTDDDLASDTETFTQYIVVYDPSAGFVTGGGWINSPVGAYPADPGLVGKANFGFVSKYITQKDKTTPVLSGNTEFQFHAGSLNFSSTSYDWMVVQGTTKASYKGSGTVNGAAGYDFLLSVVDGGSTGDKFRMKIWNKATSAIVYDNQLSAVDDATASQLIAGGSIVIHTNGGLANK